MPKTISTSIDLQMFQKELQELPDIWQLDLMKTKTTHKKKKSSKISTISQTSSIKSSQWNTPRPDTTRNHFNTYHQISTWPELTNKRSILLVRYLCCQSKNPMHFQIQGPKFNAKQNKLEKKHNLSTSNIFQFTTGCFNAKHISTAGKNFS